MQSPEESKRDEVRKMFDGIARRYDLLNTLLSFGQDRRWRRRAVRMLSIPRGGALLDVAAGTADVALDAIRAFPDLGLVLATDFSAPMLDLAKRKIEKAGLESRMFAAVADAEELPFPDESMDAVTIAFGIRNVVGVPTALSEFFRVLRPGGRLLVLEFAEPRGRVFGPLFRWYFTRILPLIGGIISGSRSAYEYLPRSVGEFFKPEELKRLMEDAGFSILRVRRFSFGVVLAYLGEKSE